MSYDNPFVKGDEDLYPILTQAKDNELEILAEIISNKFSSSIDKNCRSPLKIASEIQLIGGNCIANKIRGHGVCYREIVLDVASAIEVENIKKDEPIEQIKWKIIKKDEPIEQIEWKILIKLLPDIEDKIDKEDKRFLYIHLRKLGFFKAATSYCKWRNLIYPIKLVSYTINNTIDGIMIYSTIPCMVMVSLIRARIAAEQAAKDIGGI